MNRIVDVRQCDIYNGAQYWCDSCPVALALARAGVERPRVQCLTIFGIEDEVGWQYHMPRSVRRFVARFDSGKPVKPFRFVLRKVSH